MNIEDEKIKDYLFNKGVDAFINHQFYDAHEHWEDLWSDYRLVDAIFIQGLIQLAVGYFHVSNNNKNGAISLLKKCKSKFDGYQPIYRGLDVDGIFKGIENSLSLLSEIKNMNDFDWNLVPKISKNEL